MANDASDTLARICARTREEVARRSEALPLGELRARVRDQPSPGRGFVEAIRRRIARREIALIAEIKRASPSAGLIRPDLDPADFDPAAIARDYEAAGAACLSVLTEGPSFQGAIAHLQAARAAVSLPVLRKDFILQEWQVFESRLIGADCILLIMAALGDGEAASLLGLADSLDLDVLVEVHDEAELQRALALPAPQCARAEWATLPALAERATRPAAAERAVMIGIINRKLRTLRTDLATTVRLAPLVPADRIIIAESGIATRDDVRRLADAGACGFLVGESLLRQPDVRAAAEALLGRDTQAARAQAGQAPPC